jgi:hypothetical protein
VFRGSGSILRFDDSGDGLAGQGTPIFTLRAAALDRAGFAGLGVRLNKAWAGQGPRPIEGDGLVCGCSFRRPKCGPAEPGYLGLDVLQDPFVLPAFATLASLNG